MGAAEQTARAAFAVGAQHVLGARQLGEERLHDLRIAFTVDEAQKDLDRLVGELGGEAGLFDNVLDQLSIGLVLRNGRS